MTSRRVAALLVCLAALFAVLPAGPADATARTFPGVDCTDPPTPDMPGEGLPAFFEKTPDPLPEPGDPFAKGSRTTIYEQYGYAGLRWHTYDLGCGPDAARNPDAVIGTALSNWINNIPISMSALTSSVTEEVSADSDSGRLMIQSLSAVPITASGFRAASGPQPRS